MELVKEKDHLTFKIEDVTFFIRSTPTVRDKLELDTLGRFEDGKFVMDRSEFFRRVVQLFVVGWEGVTENGTAVPYSFDVLLNRLPYDPKSDWLLRLGSFIADSLKLFSEEGNERKNG